MHPPPVPPPVPSIEKTDSITATDFASLQQMVVNMAERLERLTTEPPRSVAAMTEPLRSRTYHDATPATSAFGGHCFIPQGIAARRVFAPFGNPPSPLSPNPEYDRRGRMNFPEPPKFTGKQTEFDAWIRSISAKLTQDVECFKREDSRMAYVMSRLSEEAERTLSPRYDSEDCPFSCLAEMIQVLETTYHDPNQASTARREIGKLMFRRGEDIHGFIAAFNGLAFRAKLPKEDMKMLLWEHIPANLDNALLRQAKDGTVPYEAFCSHVADAAYSDSRGYEQRRAERRSTSPRRQTATPYRRASTPDAPYQRPSTPETPKSRYETSGPKRDATTTETRKATCFTCGRQGHISTECPDKDKSRRGIRHVATDLESSSDDSLNG